MTLTFSGFASGQSGTLYFSTLNPNTTYNITNAVNRGVWNVQVDIPGADNTTLYGFAIGTPTNKQKWNNGTAWTYWKAIGTLPNQTTNIYNTTNITETNNYWTGVNWSDSNLTNYYNKTTDDAIDASRGNWTADKASYTNTSADLIADAAQITNATIVRGTNTSWVQAQVSSTNPGVTYTSATGVFSQTAGYRYMYSWSHTTTTNNSAVSYTAQAGDVVEVDASGYWASMAAAKNISLNVNGTSQDSVLMNLSGSGNNIPFHLKYMYAVGPASTQNFTVTSSGGAISHIQITIKGYR